MSENPGGEVRTCPSGELTLAYRRIGLEAPGNSTPVLFLHGLSYFSYDWVGFGQRLCIDREGCAMDMRGFGNSDYSAEGDYSVKSMAADIGHLLDHLGWRSALLVAHSMGGRSATCFAAMNPTRVKGLVLLDWSPENAPEGSRRVAQTVANAPEVFADVEAVMRYFSADPDSPADAAIRRRFDAYTRKVPGGVSIRRDPYFRAQFKRQLETGVAPRRDVDLWQLLSEVRSPVLCLRATRSDLFARQTLEKVESSNPRIRTQEIAGGHNLVGDNPEAVLAAVRPFINSLESA